MTSTFLFTTVLTLSTTDVATNGSTSEVPRAEDEFFDRPSAPTPRHHPELSASILVGVGLLPIEQGSGASLGIVGTVGIAEFALLRDRLAYSERRYSGGNEEHYWVDHSVDSSEIVAGIRSGQSWRISGGIALRMLANDATPRGSYAQESYDAQDRLDVSVAPGAWLGVGKEWNRGGQLTLGLATRGSVSFARGATLGILRVSVSAGMLRRGR